MASLQILIFLAASSYCFAQTYAITADGLTDGKSDQHVDFVMKEGKVIKRP